ncbi:hypothetical protein [Paenibacillus sp. MBLB4367]|uniref:hypothetical protein n=1 Tax=Paenibacillus sp. MBLB4367 TaxID=3384767 RepID=UPI003908200F
MKNEHELYPEIERMEVMLLDKVTGEVKYFSATWMNHDETGVLQMAVKQELDANQNIEVHVRLVERE